MYFSCLPDKTHCFKSEKCAGGKLSKERLTILATVSMTGEKLPLLAIGKSDNPRCFKGLKRLPVSYRANKKAWMTGVLFEEYLRDLDKRMAKEKRSIVLVLDNCAAHPSIQLANVKLVFLPPNTTSKTQPLDAGIIRCFKAHYRSQIAQLRLIAFDRQEEFHMDILKGLHLIKAAWQQVSGKLNCLFCIKCLHCYTVNSYLINF